MIVKDPVCGMDVDTASAEWRSDYREQTYYFCSPGCKSDFDRDPAQYLPGLDLPGPNPTGVGGGSKH